MRKLKGICNFCKNKSENIYGDYCLKAYYRDHGGGYGDSWSNNDCKYDQNHDFKDLFVPINLPEVFNELDSYKAKLQESIKEQDKIIEENRQLRKMIAK